MKIGKAMVRVDLQVRKPAGCGVQEYLFGIPDHEDLIVLLITAVIFGCLRIFYVKERKVYQYARKIARF